MLLQLLSLLLLMLLLLLFRIYVSRHEKFFAALESFSQNDVFLFCDDEREKPQSEKSNIYECYESRFFNASKNSSNLLTIAIFFFPLIQFLMTSVDLLKSA